MNQKTSGGTNDTKYINNPQQRHQACRISFDETMVLSFGVAA